jgi:hypothetical protein
VPVIVATQLDARLNAFFYMAWVLGATVDVLAVNMVMSLTVEGARDASGMAAASRAVLTRMTMVLLPIAVAIVVGAEYALSLFGPGYASNGTALLRLLGLAVLPKALIELYIGVLRVRRQTRLLAGLQAARLCGIVALVLLLTDRARLAGPGYAVLVVSAALSLAVLPALLRAMRTAPRGVPASGSMEGGTPARAVPAAIGRVAVAGARWKRRVTWPDVGVWSMFAAGLCLFWVPLRDGVRLDRMSGFGLITVLPVATLAGAALLVVAFMLSLALRRRSRTLLVVQLLAAVVSLHGLAPALESFARPPTAWQHAGFVDYIARTGTADYGLDARFSWPGFFAAVALVTRAAGITDLEPLLHWAPIAAQLLYLAPLALILRAVRANWRAKWLAAWLFVVADWVGQDYFSPQAFGYLLYLVFIAVLLNWFRPEPPHPDHLPVPGPLRWRGLLHGPFSAGERTLPEARGPERAVLVAFLIAVGVVVTVSHQLTPFLIILVSGALVLGRLCTLRTLPILVAVVVASWITFFTAAYWTGHSGALFSGIGRFLTNITAGFAGRMSETSPELTTLQATRAAIAMLIVSLAVFGLVRRRWWGIDDRVAPILLLAPFAALGLQQYGGEMTLRVYFFVLPGACLLAAYLFFPAVSGGPPRARTVAAVTACGLAIAGGFLFVRFGNETFEHVRRDDARALEATLRSSPAGRVTVVWLTDPNNGGFPQMPWGLHHPERFDYLGVPFDRQSSPADLAPVIATLNRYPGSYFITTRANNDYLVHNHGLRAGHDDRLRAALAGSRQLRPVRVTGNSAVYALRNPPPGGPPPVPEARGFSFGDTPWTPVGLVAAPLLVALLAGREMRPVRPPGPRLPGSGGKAARPRSRGRVPGRFRGRVPGGSRGRPKRRSPGRRWTWPPARLRGWLMWRRHWSHPLVPVVLGAALIAVIIERFWVLEG